MLHHQFKQAGKILHPNEERWMTPQSSSIPCRSPGRGSPISPRAAQTPPKQEQQETITDVLLFSESVTHLGKTQPL